METERKKLGAGLFFAEDAIETIRLRSTKPRYCKVWENIRRTADHIAESGSLLVETDTLEIWYYVRNRLMDLSFIVLAEGREKHKQVLNKVLLELCGGGMDFWQGPSYPNRPRTLCYQGEELLAGEIETAQMAMGVAIAYDWAYAALTKEVREAVLETLKRKAIPLLYHSVLYQSQGRVMNHLCVMASGLMVALLVTGNSEEYEKELDSAKRAMELWLNQVEDDGSYGESYHYLAYSLNNLFLAAYAMKCKGQEELSNFWRLKGTLVWALQNQVGIYRIEGYKQPAAVAVNFYDSPWLFQMEAPEMLLYTRMFGMPLGQWYIDHFLLGELERPDCLHRAWHRCDSILIALDEERMRPRSPQELGLPAASYYPDTGFVYMRDSWERCGELWGDTVLTLESGGGGRCLSHQHYDKNSITLFAKGEYFLVDPGHSCYRGESYQRYDCKTAAHNTLTIDGQDQCLGYLKPGGACVSFSNQAYVTGRRFTNEICYIASDAHRCYEPPLKCFVRRVWYVKPGYFVIWDHVDAAGTAGRIQNGFTVNQYDGKTDIHVRNQALLIERPRASLRAEYLYPPLLQFDREEAKLHMAYHTLSDQKVEGQWGSAIRMVPRPADEGQRCLDFVSVWNILEKGETPVQIQVVELESNHMAFETLSFEIRAGGHIERFVFQGEKAHIASSAGWNYDY